MRRVHRRPFWRRLVWSSLAGLAAGLVLVEITFRWLLFGGATAEHMAGDLRHAAYFADSASDDDFWKLFLELDRIQRPILPAAFHPELGWVSSDIDAKTLRHVASDRLGERRPVLFYGDSFARCMGKRTECFEILLDHSDLADRYVLLNHGVQGYGLDQIYLLIERTVDAYAGRNPVVVVAVQVDDCLDRPILTIRGWPKPRLRFEGDALVTDVAPILSMEEYLSRRPILIWSYAWRYLLYGAHVLPKRLAAWAKGEAALVERKKSIDRKILEAIVGGLRRRGIESFFLLFYGEPYLNGSSPPDWRERLLRDFFRENQVPFTSAGRAVLEDSARTGRAISDYFSPALDENRGHLLPIGNEVSFRALRDGLEGRFETP